MTSDNFKESLKQQADIVRIVGDYVKLRKAGAQNFSGLCPFHNEKTPSFTVSPAKGIYKCFGCGKAGNAVNFIMEHEHFTYPEALRYLAGKYGVEIHEEVPTPEMQQEQNEKESLFNLNLFAQQYFSKVLFETEEGKAIGLSYLMERGIREDIIRKFQLGYCPDPWDAFTRHALAHGYKREYLVKSGLSLEKDDRMYDRFHSRAIFPIHSASGRANRASRWAPQGIGSPKKTKSGLRIPPHTRQVFHTGSGSLPLPGDVGHKVNTWRIIFGNSLRPHRAIIPDPRSLHQDTGLAGDEVERLTDGPASGNAAFENALPARRRPWPSPGWIPGQVYHGVHAGEYIQPAVGSVTIPAYCLAVTRQDRAGRRAGQNPDLIPICDERTRKRRSNKTCTASD